MRDAPLQKRQPCSTVTRAGRNVLHSFGMLLAVANLLPAQVQTPTPCVRFDDVATLTAEAPLPETWSLRAVSGEDAPSARVSVLEGTPALTLAADSAAGQIWRELDHQIEPQEGRLEWTWRVDRAPARSVLGDPALDDAPARVFVVFGGGGLFGRPRILFYTWGRAEAVGHNFISYVSSRAAVIVLRNENDGLGAWFHESRDVFDDFHRIFDREPDEIRAVGFMADTEQTGGSSVSFLRNINWNPGQAGTERCPP